MSVYCTSDLVKSYLYGIDMTPLIKAGGSVDFFVNQFMPIAAAEMDRFMRQTLNTETLTGQRFDGTATTEIVIPNWPLQAVTSCTIYYGWGAVLYQFQKIHHKASRLLGLPTDPPDQNADLLVDRDKGIIMINPSSLQLVSQQGALSPLWNWVFTEGVANISVDYTHGFSVIPQDVQACQAMLTAILVGEMAAGRPSGGATSIKIGTVSRTWGNKAYASMFDMWMTMIQSILTHYQVREASF